MCVYECVCFGCGTRAFTLGGWSFGSSPACISGVCVCSEFRERERASWTDRGRKFSSRSLNSGALKRLERGKLNDKSVNEGEICAFSFV